MPVYDGSCDKAIWFDKTTDTWRIGLKSQIGKFEDYYDEASTCPVLGNQKKCPLSSGPPYKNGRVWTYFNLGGCCDRSTTTTDIKVKCTSFTNGK